MRAGLRRQVGYLNETFMPRVLEISPAFIADVEPTDSIDEMRQAFQQVADDMVAEVSALETTVASEHTADWIANVRQTIGVDLSVVINTSELLEPLKLFGQSTAGRIKGISADLANDIARETLEALRQGQSQVRLARTLSLRYNQALHGSHVGRTVESRERNLRRKRLAIRRHADPTTGTGTPYRYQSRYEFIARDQTSKLIGELDRLRQQQIGVDEYDWATSADERVRPTHRSKNGKRFRWDEPPPETGHPGEDYQCRCVARAVIS